jgi:replicative superfamily II helicase
VSRFTFRTAFFCLLTTAAPALAIAADAQTPAFMQPEVLKAALQIGLSEEQQPKFRDGVTAFVNCRIAAFNRIMKGRDQTDIERRLRSKSKSCARDMDKTMEGFMTEEQLPRYENYREVLTSYMKGM